MEVLPDPLGPWISTTELSTSISIDEKQRKFFKESDTTRMVSFRSIGTLTALIPPVGFAKLALPGTHHVFLVPL